jgi:hypothetical protein
MVETMTASSTLLAAASGYMTPALLMKMVLPES